MSQHALEGIDKSRRKPLAASRDGAQIGKQVSLSARFLRDKPVIYFGLTPE